MGECKGYEIEFEWEENRSENMKSRINIFENDRSESNNAKYTYQYAASKLETIDNRLKKWIKADGFHKMVTINRFDYSNNSKDKYYTISRYILENYDGGKVEKLEGNGTSWLERVGDMNIPNFRKEWKKEMEKINNAILETCFQEA